MFKYLLMMFGISVESSIWNRIQSAIIFVLFSVFVLHMSLTLVAKHDLVMTLIKCFAIMSTLNQIISYLIFILKCQKITALHQELKSYKRTDNYRSEALLSVVSLVVSILTLTLINLAIFNDLIFEHAFEESDLDLNFKGRINLIGFLFISWNFTIQFIHFEITNTFYSILHEYYTSLKRKNVFLPKPSLPFLIRTQTTLNRFIHFQTLLDREISCMTFFIVSGNLGTICVFIFCTIFYLVRFMYYSSMILIIISFIFILSLVTTQTIIFSKKSVPLRICEELEKWQQFKEDSQLAIDLQILKLSMNIFLRRNMIEII